MLQFCNIYKTVSKYSNFLSHGFMILKLMIMCSLFRNTRFLMNKMLHRCDIGQSMTICIQIKDIWLFFQNLLCPPFEAAVKVDWLLAPRIAVWKQKCALWQLQSTGYFQHARGCPGVPRCPDLAYMGLNNVSEEDQH